MWSTLGYCYHLCLCECVSVCLSITTIPQASPVVAAESFPCRCYEGARLFNEGARPDAHTSHWREFHLVAIGQLQTFPYIEEYTHRQCFLSEHLHKINTSETQICQEQNNSTTPATNGPADRPSTHSKQQPQVFQSKTQDTHSTNIRTSCSNLPSHN